MTIRFTGTSVTESADHDVSVSDAYWKTVTIQCDGAPVTPVKHTGHVTFRCGSATGDHTVTLTGTPTDAMNTMAW